MSLRKLFSLITTFAVTVFVTALVCGIASKDLVTQETITLLIRKHDLKGNLSLDKRSELFYVFVNWLEVIFWRLDALFRFFPSIIKTLIWTRSFLNILILLPLLMVFSVIFYFFKNKTIRILLLGILVWYVLPVNQWILTTYNNAFVNSGLNIANFSRQQNTWIWGGDRPNEDYYPYTNFKFNWKQKHKTGKAELTISSLGHYQLFVNGQYVGHGPSFAVYPRVYYDTYNIAEYVLSGENEIKIIVNFISEQTHEYYHYPQPGLMVGGVIKDGIIYRSLSDWRFWKVASLTDWKNSQRISADAGYAETVDLTSFPKKYQRASRIKLDEYRLEPRLLPLLTQRKEKPLFNKSILNLGSFSTGYLQIDTQFKNPCSVTINWLIKNQSTNDSYSNQSDRINFPAGNNSWTQFSRRSGEYVYINSSSCQGNLTPSFIHIGMPFDAPKYTYSGIVLDENIFKISLNSLTNNIQNHFEDCVEREKAMYVGDAYQESKCLAVGGNGKLIKEMVRRFAQRQENNGMIPSMVPANVQQYIPSYSLQWVIWLSWYVKEYKDSDFAMEMKPYLLKVMSWANRHESALNGFLTNNLDEKGWWDFIDWTPIDNSLAYQTALQIWYYRTLEATSKIYGIDNTGLEYHQKAEKLKRGLINLAYDKKRGLFADSFNNEQKAGFGLVTNSLAGTAELFPSQTESQNAFMSFFKQGKVYTDSPFSQSWVVEWLLNNHDYSHALLLIRGYWGSMVNNGASSVYETYSPTKGESGSYSHAWGCGPLYFYQELAKLQEDEK